LKNAAQLSVTDDTRLALTFPAASLIDTGNGWSLGRLQKCGCPLLHGLPRNY
jgi:hypothetical protein